MGKEFDPQKLGKWEIFLGTGGGGYIHVDSKGKVSEYDSKIIPSYVSFLYPLVCDLIPEEFLETGEYMDKLNLEEKLEEIFPKSSPNEIYSNVCARLVHDGIKANEAAKVLLDISPLKVRFNTGEITKETLGIFQQGLANKIKQFYPGLTKSMQKRNSPFKEQNKTMKQNKKDSIPF